MTAEALRRTLSELIARYDVPGASVSLLADGAVTDAAAGVVNLRTGVAAQPDSPFMIQSITKVWTATLVMQLVDDGLVELDAPVVRYLPDFRTADRTSSDTITVRQLLTHTGGFEGDLWAPTTDDEDALRLFVDGQVARAPQHLPPGHLFSYCSAGMGVLGRLVEVLRGTTYAGALRRHLVAPLGVEGVAVDAGEALGHRTAIGHVRPRRGEPLAPLRTWAVMPASNPAAGNQLAMPARGLVELARMHLADGLGPGGVRLLSAESARLMRSPHVAVPATVRGSVGQGIGWRVTSSGRVVEHDGGAPGCAAALRLWPDRGAAVAVLANGGDMSGLFRELFDGLSGDLAGLEPTPVPEAPPEHAPVTDPSRYCGRFELHNQVADVAADAGGRLRLTVEERNDAATMSALAGAEVEPAVYQLRRFDGELFRRLAPDGRVAGFVEFIDTDDRGRARFLHDGRAAPRVD